MDLTDQTICNTNEICIQDSLNASLMKLKVQMGATSVAPNNNDLIIYVDKQSSNNPTSERKQYVFNLSNKLNYCSDVGDELIQQFKLENDKLILEAFVKRRVGTNAGVSYVLESSITEEIDASMITLFEGVNYIYTNYTNAEVTVIYPKDNDLTKSFLSNSIFYEYLMENTGLSSEDIYFKDAFTKTGNKLNLEVDNACFDCITSKNNNFSLDSDGNLVVNSITSNVQNDAPTIDNSTICNLIYPVGSIYMSVNSTNPSTLFGGTWTQLTNRFLIGASSTYGVNTTGGAASVSYTPGGSVGAASGNTGASSGSTGAPSNNTSGSTAITVNQMPSHTHTQNAHSHVQNNLTWMNDTAHYDTRPSGSSGYYMGAALASYSTNSTTATNNNTGGGQGHTHTLSPHTHSLNSHTHSLNSHTHSFTGTQANISTMPPYLSVYMWKRTA